MNVEGLGLGVLRFELRVQGFGAVGSGLHPVTAQQRSNSEAVGLEFSSPGSNPKP